MLLSSIYALAASLSTVSAVYQGFNYGSTYTDGSAISQSDYETLFTTAQNLVGHSGFTSARIYTMIQAGTTDGVISAIPAAINTKTTLLLGMWASAGQADFDNELSALTSAIASYGSSLTDLLAGISVGSEDLYRISPTGIENMSGAGASPDTLVSYIQQVRAAIAGTAASSALVGHVDTWTAWVNGSNDAVIDNCDFLGMDAYPYFQTTEDNGIDVANTTFFDAYDVTIAASTGKPVWITETGWPISGPTENLAVPSLANAKTYWDEVACSVLGKINTFWYTIQDAYPDTPAPSFGLVGTDLSTTPLYDLTCPGSSSSSSSSTSSTATSTASSTATEATFSATSATLASTDTSIFGTGSATSILPTATTTSAASVSPESTTSVSTESTASAYTESTTSTTAESTVSATVESTASATVESTASATVESTASATVESTASATAEPTSTSTEQASVPATTYVTPTSYFITSTGKATTIVVTSTDEVTITSCSGGCSKATATETATETSAVETSVTETSATEISPAETTTTETTATAATATAAATGVCTTDILSGEYQYPHLIVPVSSAEPTTASGTSYFGEISSTVSSIFNFDIPASYAGKTCTLVFLFPTQAELETSSYTISGEGGIEIKELSAPATEETTYDTVPAAAGVDITLDSVTPGNSYVAVSHACGAGQRIAFELSATGSLALEYFQDYNPSPIGLYISVC